MTRIYAGARGAVTMMCITVSMLVVSSSSAFAEYRAWFSPWDYVGDFQPGDLSEDYSTMIPPDEACGFRITDPSYYRWTDDVTGTITSDDLYKDVIVWIDNPGDGCSRPFSVRYHDDSHTFLPPAGAVSIEISTNHSAYWVNDHGYSLYTCGNCVGPGSVVSEPFDQRWLLLSAMSAFKDVSASLVDVRRQATAAAAISALSSQVMQLQADLDKYVSNRRRVPLAGIEAAVRSLEDAAKRALTLASTAAATCGSLSQRGAYTDAFVACTRTADHLDDSGSLMRAARFLYSEPSDPDASGSSR